jgi:predicted ArsR family transcriptional regulator
MNALTAYVAAGGSVRGAADLLGIRSSTLKRHLADLRARSGLTTEQLIYTERAVGWLVVPSLKPG